MSEKSTDVTANGIQPAGSDWRLETLAVREGIERTGYGEHSEPLFATSSFVFESAEEAARKFSGSGSAGSDEIDYLYSRFSNPTVNHFQQKLAALEGGESCIATASGMSAIFSTIVALLHQGDHIVASKSMFGSTVNLFEKILPRLGISVSWVKLCDPVAWQQAVRQETRMFFLETPTNPLTEVADIAAIAAVAKATDVHFVVDNCFCTPALQRPLELGATIVIHSATKYIDGQGRCVGGAVVGPASLLDNDLYAFMRSAGPSMSPFNAWVFSKGLETLSLRMQRHCENAAALASWLDDDPRVGHVYYPGLQSHPQHALAAQQQSGFGGIVSFELAGGQSAAWQLIDGVNILSITANLGDSRTTITHPATTTHGRMSEADRDIANVKPGLVRVSVGLEHVDDIIADIDQALK